MQTAVFGLPIAHVSSWIFNCYVIHDEDDGLVVFDPGLPTVAKAALELITNQLDRGPDDIRAVMCSHGHPDHVGGVSTLTDTCSAEVVLPVRCEAYLSGGETPRTFPLIESTIRFMPVYREQSFSLRALLEFASIGRTLGFGGPPEMHIDFEPTTFVDTGDGVASAPGWEVIHTPGHTDDSTSLYHADTATLLSGDAVVTQDGAAWFNPEFVDPVAAAASEDLLRSLEVRHLFPGHGQPIEASNVWATARSALDQPTGRSLLARCSRRFGRW